MAYGILRWSSGYADPFLGIVVRPDSRGNGLGTKMMRALIDAARERGAQSISLHVYKWNPAKKTLRPLGIRANAIQAVQRRTKGIFLL